MMMESFTEQLIVSSYRIEDCRSEDEKSKCRIKRKNKILIKKTLRETEAACREVS